MGIFGLQKFMKNNGCCEQVRLSDIADVYRNKTGKDPVLLVDYASIIIFFYTSSPCIKTVSGDLKKFLENFKHFISNCKELGIELKIFAEGKRPSYKYRKWIEAYFEIFEDLRGIYSGQTNASSRPSKRVLFWVLTDYLMLKDNCKFSQAIYEADDDIMKYLKTEDCFAVFTNDSDFIMVDNVHYCLTADNLNLQSMTFFNFNRNNLAKLLDINASQFPFFASLCICHFQCSDLLELYKQKNISISKRFFAVAKLIKNITSKEELLKHISPLMKTTDLERRLEFYCGEERKDVRHTGQNHWDKIVNFAEERHITGKADPSILSIIEDKVHFNGFTVENIFMPLHENALLTLRKKVYGILFLEHPNSLIFVTEFSWECLQEGLIPRLKMQTIVVERRSHPGLLKLWSLENSDSLNILRQTLFLETINNKLTAKDFSRLNIPLEYVFPILATFYLLWEFRNKKFEEFEVEIILIQAVLTNRLTYEQIEKLPEEFHREALDLTGWFLKTLDCFRTLNSVCGEPFCGHKTNLIHFFDGRVMQYVYGKMKERENPWTSFNQYKKEYETLISVLYELGRICGHIEPKEKNRGYILNGDTTN